MVEERIVEISRRWQELPMDMLFAKYRYPKLSGVSLIEERSGIIVRFSEISLHLLYEPDSLIAIDYQEIHTPSTTKPYRVDSTLFVEGKPWYKTYKTQGRLPETGWYDNADYEDLDAGTFKWLESRIVGKPIWGMRQRPLDGESRIDIAFENEPKFFYHDRVDFRFEPLKEHAIVIQVGGRRVTYVIKPDSVKENDMLRLAGDVTHWITDTQGMPLTQ